MLRWIAVLWVLLSAPALAGPFGLEMGMKIEQLKKLVTIESEERGVFKVQSVPKPHPKLTSYYLLATAQHGLCKISAGDPAIRTSVYGSELVDTYSSFKKALTEKYGEPDNDFDFLRNGSIWKDANEWMVALVKRERVLASFWVGKKHS